MRLSSRALLAALGMTATLLSAGCASAPPAGPPSPVGAPPPYTVDGRTYVPLADWRGFVEEGLASWYGPGHAGRPTASGERFDPDALTAAHPVLPMNACVRVESLESGREVTVRVTDRGPFVPGRVIDLSRAAARIIGLVGPGLARVRVSAVGMAGGGRACAVPRG